MAEPVMNHPFLIVETPRAGEMGHKVLVPPGLELSEKQATALFSRLANCNEADFCLFVRHEVRQSLRNGSLREGLETLVIANLDVAKLPKVECDRLRKVLEHHLRSLVDLVNTDDVKLTHQSMVQVAALQKWADEAKLSSLPGATMARTLEALEGTKKKPPHKYGVVATGSIGLIFLALVAMMQFCHFHGPRTTPPTDDQEEKHLSSATSIVEDALQHVNVRFQDVLRKLISDSEGPEISQIKRIRKKLWRVLDSHSKVNALPELVKKIGTTANQFHRLQDRPQWLQDTYAFLQIACYLKSDAFREYRERSTFEPAGSGFEAQDEHAIALVQQLLVGGKARGMQAIFANTNLYGNEDLLSQLDVVAAHKEHTKHSMEDELAQVLKYWSGAIVNDTTDQKEARERELTEAYDELADFLESLADLRSRPQAQGVGE